MKRTISIILALMMFFALFAGCGADNSDPAVSPDASAEANGDAENTADEFTLGEIVDGSYTNAFAELNFTLPEGWIFATDEELENIMGAGSEVLFGEDESAAAEYAKQSTVYDMMTQSANADQNIIVMFENTAMYVGGTSISEEDYIQILAENLTTIENMKYVVGETHDATIGGKDYKVLEVGIDGTGVYQSYYVRRVGKYMLCICFTGATENPGDTLGAYFA